MAYDLKGVITLRDEFSKTARSAQKAFRELRKEIKSSANDFKNVGKSAKQTANEIGGITKVTTKINSEFKDMNAEIARVESTTKGLKKTIVGIRAPNINMSGSQSSVMNLNGAFATLIGTVGGFYGIVKGLEATLGSAMEQEMNALALRALFKDNTAAADDFFDFLKDKSVESTASIDDLLMGGRGFVAMSKDLDVLKDMVDVAERLSMVNPSEGFEGAQFSMRELLAGDAASIKERFNISGAIANEIKDLPTIEAKIKALDKALADMGFTQDYVNTINETAYGKWQKLGDTISQTFTDIGMGALEQAKPAIDSMVAALDSKEFLSFKADATTAFAGLIQNSSEAAQYLYNNRAEIAAFGKDALNMAKDIGGFLKDTAVFIVDNWNVIKPIIIGVVTAFLAFKTVTTIISVIQGITKTVGFLIKAFGWAKKAVVAIRLSMLLFPGGWLIAAIGAVVTAGIWLYKNWDTVKQKTTELWNKLGEFKGVATMVLGPLGLLIRGAVDLASNWDSTKSVWENVWGSMKRTAENAVNDIIRSINHMIEKLNKIPGVNIGTVNEVDWTGSSGGVPTTKALSQPFKQNFPTPNKFSTSLVPMRPDSIPGFSTGLESVPYDDMPVRVHKDESILTADQSNLLRRMGVLKSAGGKPVLDTSAMNKQSSSSSNKAASNKAIGSASVNIEKMEITINGAQKTTKEMARELVTQIKYSISNGALAGEA